MYEFSNKQYQNWKGVPEELRKLVPSRALPEIPIIENCKRLQTEKMDHETPEGGDTRKVGTKSRNLKKKQSDKKSCDKKVKKKKNKDGKTWNIHKSQKRNKSPKESESPKESKIGTQDKLSEDNIPKILFSDKKHIKVELTVLQKAIQCNEIFLRDLAYCASMDSLMKNMFIPVSLYSRVFVSGSYD